MHPEISEAERFPLLTEPGRRFLHALREHPQAPHWNWPNGEQLDASGLERVRRFAERLNQPAQRDPWGRPVWLQSLVDFCLEESPFYRRRARPGTSWDNLPSCCRDDLSARPWDFVPDCQPLDHLIVFSSSGTTGHPAKLPTHPWTAASGIPLLELALRPYGVHFARGCGSVAICNVVAYRGAYTTAIVVAYLNEAGCLRLNLQGGDWRDGSHPETFINHWPAGVILGDPISLAALARLKVVYRPQAVISSISALTDALAAELAARFQCPVLDVYALTEAGIVGVRVDDGYVVLPPDLYVEILDANDQACPPGVRGEVTVSGGRNPFAPLLRYRTGDFASMQWRHGSPVLCQLEGRSPVIFGAFDGRPVHSMEVSRALRRFPLAQFTLRQDRGGHLILAYRGAIDDPGDMREALLQLFGRQAQLTLNDQLQPPPRQHKVIQYASAWSNG